TLLTRRQTALLGRRGEQRVVRLVEQPAIELLFENALEHLANATIDRLREIGRARWSDVHKRVVRARRLDERRRGLAAEAIDKQYELLVARTAEQLANALDVRRVLLVQPARTHRVVHPRLALEVDLDARVVRVELLLLDLEALAAEHDDEWRLQLGDAAEVD